MDKLEHYLDQVCRSIGGPRALRQHVRQELREHLRDAVAQHKTAGLSAEAALDKALEEFGKPEDVRSELEATHGHRMMAVVMDKAMQWKETTMKAKWLWMTWTYLTVGTLIALELLFILFNTTFTIPKFQKLMVDGAIDRATVNDQGVSWMPTFLGRLQNMVENLSIWWIILPAAAWGLFEWRVKSENKAFMRLSVLGTIAVGLMVVVVLTSGSLVIPYELGAPSAKLARPFALQQIADIDESIAALDLALAAKNWDAMQGSTDRASRALDRLTVGPVIAAMRSGPEPLSNADLRTQVQAARSSLLDARQAIREKDAEKFQAAIQTFHEAYDPVDEAAKRAK